MTALFWTLAAGLAAAGVGFLAWPLLRGAPPARPGRRAATLEAHRARLAEIEADGEAPPDDPAASHDAQDDVARSLLHDLGQGDDQPAVLTAGDGAGRLRPRRRAAVVLALSVPLAAAGLYALLGEPRGLDPPAVRDAEAIGQAVGRLLAEAEALARENGNRLEGEPARLIEHALALAPDHRKALWFAAIAALHEERAEDARVRLEHLRSLGPLDETETGMFDQLMNETAARLRDP